MATVAVYLAHLVACIISFWSVVGRDSGGFDPAGKFAGDDVGMFVKKSGIMDKVKHQELIIPGYAAAIAGDVEEELPGWTITVGPREAAHLPGFLRSR